MTRPPLLRLIPLAFVLALLARPAAAQVAIRGIVQDAETKGPLAGAHVGVRGTDRGTVTNEAGRFALRVPRLPATLTVQHVGYETAAVPITTDSSGYVRIVLTPAVIQLGEMLVSGEDPATSLMRRVLEHKRQWWPRVRSYAASGFTRLVLERDATIVLLSDAQYDVYWDRERGPREVVRYVSQTAGWHHELPVHPAGHVPNLYADVIEILGLQMIGPTHPDALDHYVFRMAGRRTTEAGAVTDVYVTPRDERRATFIGTLTVLDGALALIRAELRPARHVSFPPPVIGWRGSYVQQFDHVADTAWLPTSMWSEGTLRLALDARRVRAVGVRQQVRLSNYRLNTTLPEAPYDGSERVVVAPEARWPDLLFIRGRGVVPLAEREEAALARLRARPLTLREAFPPEERSGAFRAFLRGEPGRARLVWPRVMGYEFRFRYNRVDGFYSSIGQRFDRRRYDVDWRLAQASGLSRVRAGLSVRRQLGDRLYVRGAYFRGVQPWPRHSRYTLPLASLQAALAGDDYFDYYWTQRFTAEVGLTAGPFLLAAEVTRSTDESVEREVGRSWPARGTFRPNPPIAEGHLATARLRLGLAPSAQPPGAVLRRAEVEAEHAPATVSDHTFTRVSALLDLRLPTLLRRRPEPATLALRLTASTAHGSLPAQRFRALDGSLMLVNGAGISRWGTFRSRRGRPLMGRHGAAVFWEHDFTTLPFEWLRLWPLVHRRTGLALYGAHGQTWASGGTVLPIGQPGSLHEIGLALTNVWDTPLRVNITRQLGEPGTRLTFGFRLR